MKTSIEIIIGPLESGGVSWLIKLDGENFAADIADTREIALSEAALFLGRRCHVCGCSLLKGCRKKGCSWVTRDLCSACLNKPNRYHTDVVKKSRRAKK